MAGPTARALRRQLVEELERSGCLTAPAVRRAFLTVPRERFLRLVGARDGLAAVYENQAIVTRTDALGMPTSSSSQPSIMAVMLERLDLRPGHRVLEIGTGTGYNAALLAAIVGPTGEVTSIELDAGVAAEADVALQSGGHPVRVVVGDGSDGWGAGAPFDRIVATASAAVVPRPWLDQLADDGLLEMPLYLPGASGQQAVVTFRRRGPRLESVAVVPGGFMAMRGGPGAVAVAGPRAASVSVNEFVGGRAAVVVHVAGLGLESVTPAARRRLAALVVSPPRSRRLGGGPPGRRPDVFVGLARIPGLVAVTCFRPEERSSRRGAVGLANRDGRSLALLVGGAGGGARRRLEAYGDHRAETALLDLLAEWRAARRPAVSDLVLEVDFPDVGAGVVRARWRDAH